MKPANSQELKEPVLLTPKQIKSLMETKKEKSDRPKKVSDNDSGSEDE